MKTATAKELRNEIESLPPVKLIEMVMRLARFKKENKELLTYLLFEAQDETGYISGIKETLHLLFTEVNVKSLYITKKNLRKIIRTTNRYLKYTDKVVTEIEILIFTCEEIKQLGIDITKSTALVNLYNSLLKKILKNISALHEDLQYDYMKQYNMLKY